MDMHETELESASETSCLTLNQNEPETRRNSLNAHGHTLQCMDMHVVTGAWTRIATYGRACRLMDT